MQKFKVILSSKPDWLDALAVAYDKSEPVLKDAPFYTNFGNNLHWSECSKALADLPDNAIIHTQNPSILDLLSFTSAKDFLRRVHSVHFPITEQDAKIFFEAYSVGIQHVSEILKVHDLW